MENNNLHRLEAGGETGLSDNWDEPQDGQMDRQKDSEWEGKPPTTWFNPRLWGGVGGATKTTDPNSSDGCNSLAPRPLSPTPKMAWISA